MNYKIVALLIGTAMLTTFCFGDDSPYEMCHQKCWREFLRCSYTCPNANDRKSTKARAKCFKKRNMCNRRCKKLFG
ncbi:hypothetical protein LSAT2_014337 [Lamellibrachia satsuma]|nr:hypothetical protein LSAT2_014337 [Lamellibrachia satsuma]